MISESQKEWNFEYLEEAIRVLEKPFDMRNNEDYQLITQLIDHIQFFKDLSKIDPSAHYEICHFLYYTCLKKDEALIEKGSSGKTIYIILKGTVCVVTTDSEKNDNKLNEALIKNNFDEIDFPVFQQKYEEARSKVNIKKSGEYFGDLPQRSKSSTITSIKAIELTHLACLDAKYYDNILCMLDEKKKEAFLTFYRKIPFLKNFSTPLLQKLHIQMSPIKLIRNENVYIEGEEANDIFFVYTGELKLTKTLEYEGKNMIDAQDIFPINDPYAMRVLSQKKLEIDIALLGPGQIFGEDDIEYERKRFATAKCVSAQAIILKIKATEFIRRITSIDEYAKFFIKSQINDKDVLYRNRMRQILEMRQQNKHYLTQIINQKLSKQIISPTSPLKTDLLLMNNADKLIPHIEISPRTKIKESIIKAEDENKKILMNELHKIPPCKSREASINSKKCSFNQNLKDSQICRYRNPKCRKISAKKVSPEDQTIIYHSDGLIFRKKDYIKKEEEIYKKILFNQHLPHDNPEIIKKLKIMNQSVSLNFNKIFENKPIIFQRPFSKRKIQRNNSLTIYNKNMNNKSEVEANYIKNKKELYVSKDPAGETYINTSFLNTNNLNSKPEIPKISLNDTEKYINKINICSVEDINEIENTQNIMNNDEDLKNHLNNKKRELNINDICRSLTPNSSMHSILSKNSLSDIKLKLMKSFYKGSSRNNKKYLDIDHKYYLNPQTILNHTESLSKKKSHSSQNLRNNKLKHSNPSMLIHDSFFKANPDSFNISIGRILSPMTPTNSIFQLDNLTKHQADSLELNNIHKLVYYNKTTSVENFQLSRCKSSSQAFRERKYLDGAIYLK